MMFMQSLCRSLKKSSTDLFDLFVSKTKLTLSPVVLKVKWIGLKEEEVIR